MQIHERTAVNHVLVEKGFVTGVETDRGPVECQYFINCAGQVSVRERTPFGLIAACDLVAKVHDEGLSPGAAKNKIPIAVGPLSKALNPRMLQEGIVSLV